MTIRFEHNVFKLTFLFSCTTSYFIVQDMSQTVCINNVFYVEPCSFVRNNVVFSMSLLLLARLINRHDEVFRGFGRSSP